MDQPPRDHSRAAFIRRLGYLAIGISIGLVLVSFMQKAKRAYLGPPPALEQPEDTAESPDSMPTEGAQADHETARPRTDEATTPGR